jgi:hypothetical protein
LGTLQWARVNGCAWDAGTCSGAAKSGHLEDGAEVGEGERLRLGQRHMPQCGGRRPLGGAEVGEGEQLPVGLVDHPTCGRQRAPGGGRVGPG